jgi:hypothetical protein
MGDSGAYLRTAIRGSIPPDRSFLYGFFLRPVAVAHESLLPMVGVQVLLSLLTSMILYYLARRHLAVSGRVALAVTVLFTLDPIQLVYARHVLAGTLATFVFGLYLVSALLVLGRPTLLRVAGLQLLSVLLVAVRLSYLPVTLVMTFCLPGLVFLKVAAGTSQVAACRTRWVRALRTGSVTLVLMTGFFILFHAPYIHLNGALRKSYPAYNYHDGYILLALVSPILMPEDAVDPAIATWIEDSRDERTYASRNAQLYSPTGLARKVSSLSPDQRVGNELARSTVRNALRRDPLGVIRLELQTYTSFFSADLRELLGDDFNLQLARKLPVGFRRLLSDRFNLETDEDWQARSTVTTEYLLRFPWSIYPVLLTPFWAAPLLLLRRRSESVFAIALILTLLISILVSHLIATPTARYLLSASMISSMLFGALLSELGARFCSLGRADAQSM